MAVRTKFHQARIEAVALNIQVIRGTDDAADKITGHVRNRVKGSPHLKPYGDRMRKTRTKKGTNVGTTWGPAVPVEFGTFRHAPKRILLSAAEKVGKVTPK